MKKPVESKIKLMKNQRLQIQNIIADLIFPFYVKDSSNMCQQQVRQLNIQIRA